MTDQPSKRPIPKRQGSSASFVQHVQNGTSVVVHHAKKHTGVGMVCAVAYFDPGNWGVDLQAGSQFGYSLLFVILVAGLFAAFLQVLSSRLGCVTGLDLASHTRLLLHNRPKHTLLYRWLGLYPLYVFSEVAIIATDLAELLGSAIALCLLFPKLELWHGVLITAFDVILILGMGDPLRGKPVKTFELLIGALVIAVLVCMIIIIAKVDVNWANAFKGFLPSKHIFAPGGVYTSVGILGATVMPHSLFLGSALATQDRVSFRSKNDIDTLHSKGSEDSLTVVPTENMSTLRRVYKYFKDSIFNAFRTPPPSAFTTHPTMLGHRQNNPYGFVRAHIYHGAIDVVGSLLGFAVMINSLILMLAAAVFYYGPGRGSATNAASLFDAYDLIKDIIGQTAASLFAIALLCAGQSSSIIATVAGQAVSEGFLQWRTSAVVRRLVTRLIAIIPAMVVAIAVGRAGIDTLLVASQVVLSIVLPFVTLPLLYCTSSKTVMSVHKEVVGVTSFPSAPTTSAGRSRSGTLTISDVPAGLRNRNPSGMEGADGEGVLVDYSNGKLAIAVGTTIWLIIVAANMYVIVDLGLGAGA